MRCLSDGMSGVTRRLAGGSVTTQSDTASPGVSQSGCNVGINKTSHLRVDPGRRPSLRWLALLLVLSPWGYQDQAPVSPETRQAEVGRLPRQAGPPVPRWASQDWPVVWWDSPLFICQQKNHTSRALCSSVFPEQWGQVRVSPCTSWGPALTCPPCQHSN